MALLSPYRVLDLTDKQGTLCGQILGDLGADVIQIEPPGGATGRQLGPFFHGLEDPEHSLNWWGYARGKRSIELDIDAQRDVFLELVKHTDFLIEAEPVGSLAKRGIGYAELSQLNPALIHVSMTPYGETGPKAGWAASDLTLLASSGPLALTGDEDRPPVRISVPQAWLHAAAEAATGALIALHERHQSGSGQHVSVSAQQALTLATQGTILSTAVGATPNKRLAGGSKNDDIKIRLTYPTTDGHVSITHIFGATAGAATRRLMEYVFDEGFCDQATRDKDWIGYGLALATGEEPIAEFERVKKCVEACTASKPKAELLRVAMERRLLMAPMTNIAEVVNSEQFAARKFFIKPTGDGPSADIQYPGPFARFSATPMPQRRRPPHIGEHTQEILAELEQVPQKQVKGKGSPKTTPLTGLKVLDLMWAVAGPAATRTLADFGATVVRIESSTRIDICRTIRPFIGEDESVENAAVFHDVNAGKRLLTLDLTKPEGRDVFLDLVRWCDVIAESFSPKAMKALGLDYETLRGINPNIIMLSTCLMGQTGPLAMFAGYGNLAAAITGYYSITGWPDRDPAGPFAAYTDYIAPKYNATAILAALDHRDRTGEGQHIDLAQSEASMHFLTPAILDYTANGHIQSRLGNADPYYAPHGVYPTAGDDQHIAIVCETDVQWLALCSVIPELDNTDAQLHNAKGRLVRQLELDQLISSYTRNQQGPDLEARLQAVEVPAAIVQNSPELVVDPQLNHLGHFVTLPHHEGGETVIEGARIHLSRSQSRMDTSAPTYGRDMMFVLNDLLHYDDEKIGELLIAGALE